MNQLQLGKCDVWIREINQTAEVKLARTEAHYIDPESPCKRAELRLGYCARLPIDWDTYHYIPPCLGTDVLAVVGSRSLCILAQGMHLGLVGIGKAGRSARIKPKPQGVWTGLTLKDALGTPTDTKL